MLSHALAIVRNELASHLADAYAQQGETVRLANIGEVVGSGGNGRSRDALILSMVNLREEKALKNVPHYARNEASLRVVYQNPPVYLNFHILITAAHTDYENALLMLSRAIRFFQARNVFDQDSVLPASLARANGNSSDELETFKLIFDLYSPSLEEVNHLWGTLGGKQYPFVLYTLRLLELSFKSVQGESGLITDLVTEFSHKRASGAG